MMRKLPSKRRRGGAEGWVVLVVILALLAGVVGYKIWSGQKAIERGSYPTTAPD